MSWVKVLSEVVHRDWIIFDAENTFKSNFSGNILWMINQTIQEAIMGNTKNLTEASL